MQKIKFKVFSVSATDGSIQFVGYEQLNEDGNWEYKRGYRPNYVLGTISDNQGNVTFIREQYIGIKDSSIEKVEIYKGDIVRHEYNNLKVMFIHGCYMIGTDESNYKNAHYYRKSLEVIGNIHQNGELLS